MKNITYLCRSCGNPTELPVSRVTYCGWCFDPDLVVMPDDWMDGVLFLDDERAM